MRDALKTYLSLASGFTEVTRQRAVGVAKALQAQGEATAEQVSSITEDLVEQSRANREAVTALVRYEVDRTLGRVGLASADEVAELNARVRALEQTVAELSGRAGESGRAAGSTPAQAVPRQPASTGTSPRKPARRSAGTGSAGSLPPAASPTAVPGE